MGRWLFEEMNIDGINGYDLSKDWEFPNTDAERRYREGTLNKDSLPDANTSTPNVNTSTPGLNEDSLRDKLRAEREGIEYKPASEINQDYLPETIADAGCSLKADALGIAIRKEREKLYGKQAASELNQDAYPTYPPGAFSSSVEKQTGKVIQTV